MYFDFKILVPPRITKHPNDTTINEGDNITLLCYAEGPPKPSFSWNIVSEKISIGQKISDNNILELRNVTSIGNYYFTVICKAVNKGGNTSTNATVEILGKSCFILIPYSY